jgi:hypothetical protein
MNRAPAIPLDVLVKAYEALRHVHTARGPKGQMSIEVQLLVASAVGELGFYVDLHLAAHDAEVRLPAVPA